MVSAVRLSRQAVGCRSAGRQRRQSKREEDTRGSRQSGVFEGEKGGWWWIPMQREERVCWREGGHWGGREAGRVSDVLPVSIIIGGWLTGRRFAPHNSRRPIILPRLPCTNSYVTCRHVLPSLYIITCGAILSHTFFQTIADCGAPPFRGFKIMLVKITIICKSGRPRCFISRVVRGESRGWDYFHW